LVPSFIKDYIHNKPNCAFYSKFYLSLIHVFTNKTIPTQNMPIVIKIIKFFFDLFRCSPHVIIFYLHKNKSIIKGDIERWKEVLNIKYPIPLTLIYLLCFKKPFRNVFYYRIGILKYLLNIFCPQISSLEIETKNIGEGLFIWHGFSTAIGAKSIGKNCMINHQVIIGNNNGYPTILDNVRIHPGAIIYGNITIGNNVIIGANTTVFKNIPDNCTVYPASCKIMKWNKSK
jgi:serine O-acetyltransferase